MEENDLLNGNMSKQVNVRQRNVSIDTFAFGPFILPTLFLANFIPQMPLTHSICAAEDYYSNKMTQRVCEHAAAGEVHTVLGWDSK